MEHVRTQDLQHLLACLRELTTLNDLDTFPTRALAALRPVMPALHSSYNEVNPRRQRMLYVFDSPADDFPDNAQFFLAHIHEHPIVTYYRQTHDGHARKITDFLPQQHFLRLGLYVEFYRRLDTRYQIAMKLPSPPSLTVAFVLNRDRRDFSERDRLMLNLLRPHLIQAYRNAETWSELRQENSLLRQAIDESNLGMIVVKNTGRIRSMTERARRWLEAYCGRLPHAGEWLPVEVRRWFLYQQTQWTDNNALPQVQMPLVLEREGQQLHIRLLTNTNEKQHILLLKEQTTRVTPASLLMLGLSQREAEVLYWLMQGKTNPEIGIILSVSSRTVQTHVLRVYQKLGVETRNAATRYVFERLGLISR